MAILAMSPHTGRMPVAQVSCDMAVSAMPEHGRDARGT